VALKMEAAEALNEAQNFDTEGGSIYFVPETR
jgi:hypothetical protein